MKRKLKFPVVLCILDGYGYSEKTEYNAVKLAKTPTYDSLYKKYPHTLIHAAGTYVGLPENQMGNSEVGHTTIGLGRVIYQDLPKISKTIDAGGLKNLKELQELVQKLKNNGKACHLWGLFSDGGIHSHINHLYGLIDFFTGEGVPVLIHAITDGRDTAPKDAIKYFFDFQERYAKNKLVKIATISGRFFAMDRDKHWDRIEQAYNIMTNPSRFCDSLFNYIQQSYNHQITDEFIRPIALEGYKGILPGDAFLAFNFRTDRVRQMLSVFLFNEREFVSFRNVNLTDSLSSLITMTEYNEKFKDKVQVLFKRATSQNSLGETLARAHINQLRIAETEKYPHVTFFFNGGVEKAFEYEERTLISSKAVKTYDLAPEMSAGEITDFLTESINNDKYDVYIVNYANPDMVGHTGNLEATKKSIEYLDSCLEHLWNAIRRKGGILLLTADHGNAEEMFDGKLGVPMTAHTANDVTFILASDDLKDKKLREGGSLEDIAPTILDIINIQKPQEMTGKTLVEQGHEVPLT